MRAVACTPEAGRCVGRRPRPRSGTGVGGQAVECRSRRTSRRAVEGVVGRVEGRLDDEEVDGREDRDGGDDLMIGLMTVPAPSIAAQESSHVASAVRPGRANSAICAERPATAATDRSISSPGHGEGHREADPPALPDLVPDGEPAAGLGARDQARGRGLQLDERGRLRAPLLRRPRRAREPRDLAPGREARRGLLRGRALRAAAGELLPAGDRVHRRRAGGAAHRARPARRRVRLRRAAAARAPAGLLGPAEPAHRGATRRRSTSSSRPPAAAASSRSGWRRSRPRSRAARRSSSPTTRCSATRSPTARWTPTTSSSATASSI